MNWTDARSPKIHTTQMSVALPSLPHIFHHWLWFLLVTPTWIQNTRHKELEHKVRLSDQSAVEWSASSNITKHLINLKSCNMQPFFTRYIVFVLITNRTNFICTDNSNYILYFIECCTLSILTFQNRNTSLQYTIMYPYQGHPDKNLIVFKL